MAPPDRMEPMSWFSRSRAPKVDPALRAEVLAQHPEAGDIHAMGSGPRVLVLACTECLAVRREGSEATWQFVGWHMVNRGGWNAERGVLKWSFADGEGDEVALDEPGRVPEVFRDRVQASILVDQRYEAPGGGQVIIAGRRQLGVPDAPVVWQATTVGAARLTDPAVANFVVQRTNELRGDFGV